MSCVKSAIPILFGVNEYSNMCLHVSIPSKIFKSRSLGAICRPGTRTGTGTDTDTDTVRTILEVRSGLAVSSRSTTVYG